MAPTQLQPICQVYPAQSAPNMGKIAQLDIPYTTIISKDCCFLCMFHRVGNRKQSAVTRFSPGTSDVTSFLMTEARQQNTEIRLAVGKVADKVDQLASKV